eukprot:scaffold14974_cov195-Amphora_coffeaeformis.AAC.60
MIRFIRQQLAADHSEAFAATNLQGDPLDEDAIALGIAKVFYLYTDEAEEGESATATTTREATAASTSASSAARDPTAESGDNVASADSHYQNDGDAMTTFDGEDCQLYECLTNLRQSNKRTSYRITPSPSNSPKLGPKGHPKASSSAAATSSLLPAAKRKTPVKASRSSTDKKRSKKATANESLDSDEDDDTEEPLNGKQTTSSTNATTTSEKGCMAAFPTREQLHTRAAVILSQTNASPDIPRGVTVRPSGRWQSQVYYKGQSRYLGVFSDSREAALAWTIAKRILTEMQVPGANKMETDKWFITVRDVVTDLVQGAIESAP